MTVLTVILNWRTPDMTLRAAQAARIAMEGIPGAITIVDNDSGDGSFEALTQATAGWARVIQSGRNGGFGAGNNVGIRAGLPGGARPDLVYVQNSDAFPAPDAIARLRDHLAAHPEAGLAGSLIHGPAGDIHLTTFRFPSVASELEGAMRFGPVSRLLKGRAVPLPTPDRAGRVDWLAGASLMIRMDVIDRIGAFDEGFFLYFEETDLCLRAARAGFQTHFVPGSRVEHIGSVSTGMKEWRRTPDYWFASRHRYFRKAHGLPVAIAATAAHIAGGLFHRLRSRLTGQRPADPPGFLRQLIAHDLRAVTSRLPAPQPAIRAHAAPAE